MKAAVLVIDMLNEFVTGKLGFEEARRIVPSIRQLLEFARGKGIPIVYVCDAHREGDPELKLWGPHAMVGTAGAQIIPELRPEAGEPVLEKRSYSAFFNTGLAELLRKLGVTRLILTGVVTNICIQNTAADAFYLGFEIIVPEDCTAAGGEAHRASLEYMRQIYGARTARLEDIIEGLKA